MLELLELAVRAVRMHVVTSYGHGTANEDVARLLLAVQQN